MTLEKKLERILKSEKTLMDTNKGCLCYTGANMRGLPVIMVDGKLKSVIRALVETKWRSRKFKKDSRVVNVCGNRKCLNPNINHWQFSFESFSPQFPGDERPLVQNWVTSKWENPV